MDKQIKNVLEDRIKLLEKGVIEHQQELVLHQQVVAKLSKLIVSRQGGIVELKELLNLGQEQKADTKKGKNNVFIK